MSQVSNTWLSK